MVTKGYYPGCSAKGTSKEYEMSAKKVYEALGIELQELEEWMCCGSSPAHTSSLLLADALALKNLSLAKEQGLKELIVPCMGCYSRFEFAHHDLKEDEDLRKKAEEAAGVKYDASIKKIETIHPLTHLAKNIDLIKEKLKKKPEGLKAVCYYGCVFTRPPDVTNVENFEDPKEMDTLLKAVDVEVINWNFKTKCCGVAFSVTNQDVAFELCNRILSNAKDAGADIIVVACPMCQGNLDMRQKQIEKKYNTQYNIPVLYITQILGLALGYSYKDVGLDKNFVDSKGVLKENCLL